jgi:Fic family protein
MRSFEQSHPWITFQADLTRLDHKIWLLLGEAESKCEHIAGVPLSPQAAEKLHQIYLGKGAHGTTAIEGNSLSEAEVLARVRGDLPLPPSRAYLGQEIDNVVGGYNKIVDDVVAGRPLELTPKRIADFNRRILDGLDTGEDVVPGAVRTHPVVVARYRGAPAEDLDFLLERMCEWLGRLHIDDADMVFTLAILKAILAHLYIAWIHPFGDGNGRTARLVEFQLLVQAGVPVPAAHLLANFYNRTRDAYYRVLDRTSRPPYPVEDFVGYALRGFVDELRDVIGVIRAEQMQITWENYVHDLFRDADTPARRRQKHIVLDLPADGSPVPPGRIPQLSIRVATAYVGKQPKTVTRDINALVELGAVRRTSAGVVANRSLIEAFLPVRNNN